MNIAFLASYNGSSAHAITDACLEGALSASPTLLITNNEDANALEWSENKGLKTLCVNSKTHPNPTDLDRKIADSLRDNRISLVVLSGYMRLIGVETLKAVDGRMINIHPALLPKYGGQGMYGHHVHKAVKESNEIETGITIHQVNDEYDDGKILAQKIIPLISNDSVEDIQKKVQSAEPEFYIETLRKILKKEITLD